MKSTEKNEMIKVSSIIGIKDLAETIALEYPEIITPLEHILLEEDLDLYYDNYGNAFDGMTIYADSLFHVHINTFRGNKPGSPRARFSIAHELAHYFIDNHRVGLKKGLLKPHPSKNNELTHFRIEKEADYFASCLLMPEERFKKFVLRKKFDFSVIKTLSEHFHTSITATAIRFADLGNHPIMLVFAENGKIKWKNCSKDFPFQYLLFGSKVPEDSVMGEYFYKDRVSTGTEDVWAVDWFDFVTDRNIHRKFKEHCIPHKNLAFSIIWEL
ncbi:ImmA/IrrE family metallo-endopeptidase [Flavobacterium chungbukense]|nr:ImmA/IrrE family metallo-endopeptidase [Flavobacterium chungbukense]MCC4923265.1 ImmA/IrrE family metallo-endopeptidase [Flavobacterium chungbukense]